MAKDFLECRFIDRARFGRIARMAMEPNSCELPRLPAQVHLIVEEVRHGRIVKLDTHAGHFLLDRDELSDKEQVIRIANSETADLVV